MFDRVHCGTNRNFGRHPRKSTDGGYAPGKNFRFSKKSTDGGFNLRKKSFNEYGRDEVFSPIKYDKRFN